MDERILIFNFDGTIADTFKPSPGNISTQIAYELALKDVFGDSELSRYRRQGGLKNRSPTQVVMGLGVPPNQVREATEKLVKSKLLYLLPEIGKVTDGGEIWPSLCVGFIEFWKVIQKLVDQGKIKVAIVSSGHTEFITRTFAVHKITPPSVLITDDDIRSRNDIPLERRNKPDPLILEMAAERLCLYDVKDALYFGDDIIKDGGMARNAGASFVHFDLTIGRKLETLARPDFYIRPRRNNTAANA